MPKRDYDNWLISLEADNFSSFIKVWFAYLATVHELVLKSCNEAEQEELKSRETGDGIFLDKYRTTHLPTLNINDSTQKIIKQCYDIGKEQIKKIHFKRFFVLYYKKIDDICFFNKEPIAINRDKYELDLSIRNNELHIGILIDANSPVMNKLKSRYIDFNFSLEATNENDIELVEDSFLFYRALADKCKIFLKKIKSNEGTKEYEEVQRKLQTLIQVIISILQREDLHQKIYKEKLSEISTKRESFEWIHEFSYGLRNVLFHKVVDPFDLEWTRIAKYTAQALYDIAVLNIEKLKAM